MKKLLLMITLILLSGIASADCIISTAPSGTFTNPIMSLSLPTNAHGAIAVGTYFYNLYCEAPITTGGTTNLIWLQASTNSHAEMPQLLYSNPVTIAGVTSCYSGASCNAGDTGILSLVSLTNSHIGAFADTLQKFAVQQSLLNQ